MAPTADRADVRVQPALLFLGCLAAAAGLEAVAPLAVPDPPLPVRIFTAGLLWGLSCAIAVHAIGLMKLRGTHVEPGKPTTALVTAGPYRFTRNPMYLALVVLLLGGGGLLMSAWFLIAALLLARLLERVAIRPEEAYLEHKFGDAYRDYRRRVRRWL